MNRAAFFKTSRLLRYASEEVKAWAGHRLGTVFREPCTALGIINGQGKLVGAVIYNDYEAANVEMTMIWPKGFGFRDVSREAFLYAFDELGCRRISLTVPLSREADIHYARRWGWEIEGRKRDYYGPNEHAIIMGMLRSECRLLREGK